MKFRMRMILAYATISLLISVALGVAVYRSSVRYEQSSQKNNLTVSARSIVAQAEDRLGRMKAILHYILSDTSTLDSITLLGRAASRDIPGAYLIHARAAIQSGISTDYIIQNSYRTCFFNQSLFLASSPVRMTGRDNRYNQRLVEQFQLEDIPYLESVAEADGKEVIVGAHDDFWDAGGGVPVYSLMKAVRGDGMGFLEVENRIDTLSAMELPDPEIRYAIFVNDGELLYDSAPQEAAEPEAALPSFEAGDIRMTDRNVYAKAVSDRYAVTVLTYKPAALLTPGRLRFLLTAVLSALLLFAVSLLVVFFWSNRLTRPVRLLQEIVESTNLENLQDVRRVKEIESSGESLDEFAGLAHAFRAMTGRLDTALQNEKRAATLQLQAQFDVLQTQVNPHFIYNVLNVISSRGVLAGDEVICELCGCLAGMLRYSTNNKMRYAKIGEELEYLNRYLYLLQSRYGSRLQVKTEMEADVRERLIPKMTLQQIVENCIKHAFRGTDERMEISLAGRREADRWTIVVRDNGCGVTPEKMAELREKLKDARARCLEMEAPTEAEIGGMGLVNTYLRCLLLFREELIFELGNRTDAAGFEVVIGQKFLGTGKNTERSPEERPAENPEKSPAERGEVKV